jgi:hypothetical protein
MLKREYVGLATTGLRYAPELDTGQPQARPFEGSDGRWYGWSQVTNDDGEIFDLAGEVVDSFDAIAERRATREDVCRAHEDEQAERAYAVDGGRR